MHPWRVPESSTWAGPLWADPQGEQGPGKGTALRGLLRNEEAGPKEQELTWDTETSRVNKRDFQREGAELSHTYSCGFTGFTHRLLILVLRGLGRKGPLVTVHSTIYSGRAPGVCPSPHSALCLGQVGWGVEGNVSNRFTFHLQQWGTCQPVLTPSLPALC